MTKGENSKRYDRLGFRVFDLLPEYVPDFGFDSRRRCFEPLDLLLLKLFRTSGFGFAASVCFGFRISSFEFPVRDSFRISSFGFTDSSLAVRVRWDFGLALRFVSDF